MVRPTNCKMLLYISLSGMSANGLICCCSSKNSCSVKGHVVRGTSTTDKFLEDSASFAPLNGVAASGGNSIEAVEEELSYLLCE